MSAALQQVEAARRLPDHDLFLLADVADWIQGRLALFAADEPVLVHGDVHGSNVIVDQGRVTGLIDFAEALAQPADAELDTILRWCARAREYPPTPDEQGLDETTLAEVPGWLNDAYPELFERERLREAPEDLQPLARAALGREMRADLSERYAQKLAVDIELPQIRVPFLFTQRFGREAVERISRILEDA